MNDQKITITPLMIAPLKSKSLPALLWEAIRGPVLFSAGAALGWIVRGILG